MDDDEHRRFWRPLTADFQEDTVWSEDIKPLLGDLPPNVLAICAYGCAEILNNANEHSGAEEVRITVDSDGERIKIGVFDEGIGIFRKIQQECGLDDVRHAVFELTKGKLTTDPRHHTGEGIFFTSRMFDYFGILSGEVYLGHSTWDWLIKRQSSTEGAAGTLVTMEINRNSPRTPKEVFDHYTVEHEEFGFKRTVVAIRLADEGDSLVSRSQARRIVARLGAFKEAALDFKGIVSIAPAFADEIFRVFQRECPQLHFVIMDANEDVQRMITKARAAAAAEQP